MSTSTKTWKVGNKMWARRHGGGRHGGQARSADREERAVETTWRQTASKEITEQLDSIDDEGEK